MIQLKAVAIWNQSGERRTIEFRPGELNIITGEAKTGKSALLEIVEFCLGRSTVSLPEGAVTRSVHWYGAIFTVGAHSVFVGRPAPRRGQATVSGAHLALGGPQLSFPEYRELEVNSNADGATEYLTRVTGIGEYENIPPDGTLRPPLRPTVRHASLFCFQRQNEIANPRQLFHRQEEDFMPQAIKDTLPYFLGAVDREAPTLRSRLYHLRRELRQAERRLEEARRVQDRAPTRNAALLAQAIDSGLLRSSVEEVVDPLPLLREALEAPTEPAMGEEADESEYRRLAQQSSEITDELRSIAERTAILSTENAEQIDYQEELHEQAARLETLDILPGGQSPADQCPLCGSIIDDADATISQLVAAVARTRAELAAVSVGTSTRRDALLDLETRASDLRQRLRNVHASLSALAQDRERIQSFRERAMARAYVKGRIVQHLDQVQQIADVSLREVELTVEGFRREVNELEVQLDPENERLQVVSRLNVIGDDMTEWAQRLRLEHVGGRARIDAAQLTVVVDTPDGPVSLERMGSAANWVGYHLVAHLALHKWFTQHDRPVPRFLMIDQPTQAFYPPDVSDVATEDLSDDDRESVEAMFGLISDLVRQLAPGLQVIVTDHANLVAPWFQDAVVEEWRAGNKLVPMHWLEGSSQDA